MNMQHTKFFKTNISYIKDNLISHIDSSLNNQINSPTDIIILDCFALNQMLDAQFSRTIHKICPVVEANLSIYRSQGQKSYGTTQFVELYNKYNKNFCKIIFANMICKRSNRPSRQLDYIALSRCLLDISAYIRKNYKDTTEKPIIACTKFGTGKSGGNWNVIEQMIQDSLDQYKIEVYIKNDHFSN